MANKIEWVPASYGAGFTAELPSNISLSVFPDRVVGYFGKPARGTAWKAQASQWDEASRSSTRFGRDEYHVMHKTARDARNAAEAIYRDAVASVA